MQGCTLDTDGDGNCPIHPDGCPKFDLTDAIDMTDEAVHEPESEPTLVLIGFTHKATDAAQAEAALLARKPKGTPSPDKPLCERCAAKDGNPNPPGLVRVGWGTSWQPCPSCFPSEVVGKLSNPDDHDDLLIGAADVAAANDDSDGVPMFSDDTPTRPYWASSRSQTT